MTALYPGSFDPITNGHLNIIERAAKIFDDLVVAVLVNNSKKSMFSTEERLELIREATKHIKNVRVESFSGLLADYADKINAKVLIRGLRYVSDFEYEMQMSLINKQLNDKVETIFLCSEDKFIFLSSSLVKEVASFGGDITNFVPQNVKEAVIKKYTGGRD